MSSRHIAELLALCSLVLIGIWVDITGYLDIFSDPAATGRAEELSHYACYAGRIAAAVAFLAFPRKAAMPLNRSLPLVLTCLMAGTSLYAFAFHQTLLAPEPVAIVGSALVGAGHIWAVSIVYASLLGLCPLREAFIIAASAQVVERLAVELLQLAPAGTWLIVCTYLLPIAAVTALVPYSSLAPRCNHEAARPIPPGSAAERYYIVLCIMAGIGLVACGAMSTTGIWGNAGTGQYAGSTTSVIRAVLECALVIACCVTTFASKVRRPLALRYQSSLLVIITSFVLASSRPMLSLVPDEFVGLLLVTVENYAHILFWVIALDAAHALSRPTYRVFGVGLLACSLTGLLWSFFLEHQMTAAESAVLVTLYTFLVVCIVYPQVLNSEGVRTATDDEAINTYALEGEMRLTPGVNGESLQLALEERCACLAESYGLSAREKEVLIPLLKGMTRTGICNELGLSEGTVKTHLTHIYTKLGIHSQAELIAVAYGSAE